MRLERPLSVQSASANVIDLINCLRRVNSQLTSIAYTMVRDLPPSGETSIHRPGAEMEEVWHSEEGVEQREIGPG